MFIFRRGIGDWKQYRSDFGLLKSDEIDLHLGKRRPGQSYDEAMEEVIKLVRTSLTEAKRNGRRYVMFIHGRSTSRPGKTTARSQVRAFMRSTAATPLIERRQC